jgi:RND family efflux transporter MFP subunit
MRTVALFAIGCVFFAAAIHADDKPKPEQAKPSEFTGRTDAVEHVDVRARVTGYIEKTHVSDGDRVKAGALLADIDPRIYTVELELAKAKVASATARGKLAEAEFARMKKAVATGVATQVDLDKAVADRDLAAAEQDAAKAELKRAELYLDWTRIKSPIDGLVTRQHYTTGNLVEADKTLLYTIIRTDPIIVRVDVDERTFLKWRETLGQDGKFAVAVGFATEEGFPHEAKFQGIDCSFDTSTGTVQLRATLANPKTTFLPGMFVRVRVTPQPGK